MRKVLVVLLGCLTLMAVSCTKPQYGMENDVKEKFSALPGFIELEISVNANRKHDRELRKYKLINGELILGSTETCIWPNTHDCYFPHSKFYISFPENAHYEKTTVDIPKGLPEIKGYQYVGPYSISPDNSFAFFSLTLDSYKWPYPEFPIANVLIEMNTKKIVHQTNGNDLRFLITDATWSPDSQLFAVLYESSERYHSLLGIIGNALGHPVDKYTYFLEVHDRTGKLIVRSRVAHGMLTGWGNIRMVWKSLDTGPR